MPAENIINCDSILPLLSVYVDGEATSEEAFRVERHVDACKACGSHLAFLRATSFVLTGIPDPVPDAALFARIASATYAKPSLREQISRQVGVWLRPMPVRYALGSALAVALAAIVVVPRFTANQSPLATLPSVESPNPAKTATASDPTNAAVKNTGGNDGAKNGASNSGANGTGVVAGGEADEASTRSPRKNVAVNEAAQNDAARVKRAEIADNTAAEKARGRNAAETESAKSARRTVIAELSAKTSSGKSVKTASVTKPAAPPAASRMNTPKSSQIASVSLAEMRRNSELLRAPVQLPSRQAAAPREGVGEGRMASVPENTATSAAVAAVGGAHMTKPAPNVPEPTEVAVAPVNTAGGFRLKGSVRSGVQKKSYNFGASAKEQFQATMSNSLAIVTSPVD